MNMDEREVAVKDDEMESPEHSSSESEDDSDDDGLIAFLRYRDQLRRGRVVEEEEEEGGGEGEVESDGDPKYERKYFWTHYVDSGFPNRVNHAVCTRRDKDGSYYVYSVGGYHADEDERTVVQADTHGGPFFKRAPIDVHCLDYDYKSWSKCEPPPEHKHFDTGSFQRTRVPGCRYGHTVCQYKGRLYMYGGRNDDDGSFTGVDCYDTTHNIWVKLHTSGDGPSSRDGHACSLLGNEMIMHGGFSSMEIKFSGDMYAFDLDHHTWRKFPRKGDKAPERDFHVATVVGGDKVVVFGGRSDMFAPFFTANDIYPNDFFYYNLASSRWCKVPRTGPYRPEGRRSLTAVAVGDIVLYFGGYNACKKCHYGDLFVLNTVTWECMEIRPFGDAPPPRRRVGCALIGNNLMICGGTSPVEVERKGKKMEILHDHSDMYILHLIPSLEQQCITVLVKNNINLSLLPLHMQQRIADLLSHPMKTVTRLTQYKTSEETK